MKPIKDRKLNLDINAVKGPTNRMYKVCIGAGRANEGLRADWQQQLAYIKQHCDFKYIRMHGLLTDDMGVYREDKQGKPEYNWQYIDAVYDYILSIGMKPFVELGFMPNALASGQQTIFWWRGNVTPPKDYQKWAELIKNLVQHFTERYGEKEVKTWYFEVWNEPNLSGFFTGTQAEYFKLYTVTATAIKSISPEYKVGGPATAGIGWIPEMIEYCHKNKVPIDFISTHTYGVRQGYLDEYGDTGTILEADPDSIIKDVRYVKDQIRQSPMPNLELHFTEWSSSYTPADPIHDSYHEAAYILDKLKHTEGLTDSMSYWVFTDIFEEAGPRFTPFHGGFGLINYQGINKPAFYAYQFLNQLGDIELVNQDTASWACKNKNGDIQVLLWDFTITQPKDKINNQVYYKQDLPAKNKGKVAIDIANIPSGKYILQIYKVGYRTNDAYTAYLDIGSPNQLTKQQVEQLKKNNNGLPITKTVVTIKQGSSFIQDLDLRENDVYLVTLTRK
ncbi:MAG: glycoside hydrolase [bacterium]